MNTLELLKVNLFVAHDSFAKTTADITQEMADWVPPGMAHPIGERFAHAVAAEDWMIHSIAQGGAPWFASSWAGKAGFGNASQLTFTYTTEQARAFRIDDVNALREYQNAIFADSAGYLSNLDGAAMERMIDMTAIGYGKVPAPVWWSTFVIGHVHDLMGEISILKGCLGLKGYPF